jgi:hypothetical protein
MSDANRLFLALSKSSVVPIDLIKDNNPFVYDYLEHWKDLCEIKLNLLPTVEVKRNPKTTEFHFLDGETFNASCIHYQDRFYIGFRISAVLRVFDLYIHLVNREIYLPDALPHSNFDTTNIKHFAPLLFNNNTIAEFPREMPLSSSHLEADRLAISRMILMYRAGEHAMPMAKALAPIIGGPAGQKLFDGTIANPRIYIRCVLFTLLIFFWHFGDIVTERYLDRSHPFHAARSFYLISELSRVLELCIYEPWKITLNEYMTSIANPTLLDAVKCWGEMVGKNLGASNIMSVIHQPYALRDLKRFEKNSTRITAEIKKYGLEI